MINNFTPQTTTTVDAGLTDFQMSGQTIWFIQNLGTQPLYVCFGTGCSASNFSFILAAGGSANDGTGGTFSQNYYAGPISVYTTSGTPSYIAWAANGQ